MRRGGTANVNESRFGAHRSRDAAVSAHETPVASTTTPPDISAPLVPRPAERAANRPIRQVSGPPWLAAQMLRPGLDPDIARPIGALARLAGISAATASGHLRRLVDERLVTVERAGASQDVAAAAIDRDVGRTCAARRCIVDQGERAAVLRSGVGADPAGRLADRVDRRRRDRQEGWIGGERRRRAERRQRAILTDVEPQDVGAIAADIRDLVRGRAGVVPRVAGVAGDRAGVVNRRRRGATAHGQRGGGGDADGRAVVHAAMMTSDVDGMIVPHVRRDPRHGGGGAERDMRRRAAERGTHDAT